MSESADGYRVVCTCSREVVTSLVPKMYGPDAMSTLIRPPTSVCGCQYGAALSAGAVEITRRQAVGVRRGRHE